MIAGPKNEAPVVSLHGRGFSDREIVNGLLRRNPEAAVALYRRFADRINRLVWRILGGDEEHDDVVQQIFVHVLGSIRKLRDPAALEAWIMRIAVNTVRREIRSRKARRILRLGGGYPEDSRGELEPERQLLAGRLYAVVGRMRADDQIVFCLRFVEGCTLGETAGFCRCSLSTVKRRLARAKRAFLKHAMRDPVLASWIEEACHEG